MFGPTAPEITLQQLQRPLVPVGLSIIVPDRAGILEAGQSFVETTQRLQDETAIVEYFGVILFQFQRFVKTRQRILEPPQFGERGGAVNIGFDVIGTIRKRLIITRDRLLATIEIPKRVAATPQRFGMPSGDRECLVVIRDCFFELS